jgi:hypothetical protein
METGSDFEPYLRFLLVCGIKGTLPILESLLENCMCLGNRVAKFSLDLISVENIGLIKF